MIDRDEAIEVFRLKVLDALDIAAVEVFGEPAENAKRGKGATDGDLPRIFPAVDRQVEVLAERFGVEMVR